MKCGAVEEAEMPGDVLVAIARVVARDYLRANTLRIIEALGREGA
jgi:hypothetical protein